ncbi:hypothetical protein ACVIW2_009380 [Bradyrhizobium huanghuaihaiense]
MLNLRMSMDSLELCPTFGTRGSASLCGYPLQSGRLGERDARTVFANGVDGQPFKFRLRHLPEDVLKLAAEPGSGRIIIIVRCHKFSRRLGPRCAPADDNPLDPKPGVRKPRLDGPCDL